jgi:uncharacterized repeat protein (TIGR01451 family)/choice-of-anchor A domain-containing protein
MVMVTSAGFTPSAPGTYYWVATFSGDSNNASVSSGAADESVTITGGTPGLTITKVPDSASVVAGNPIGFTLTISNPGAGTATGLTLTDPLPPGGSEFFNWKIDTGIDNPIDFTIKGTPGSQSLAFSSAFLASPDSLAGGQSISVHITTPTTVGDVSGGAVGLQAGVSSSAYLGAAGQYGVLYMVDAGTHNLSITNVTLGANVGVGSGVGGNGIGQATFSGPGTITGRVDFAPGQTNVFNNQNGSNVGPASVNHNVATVTSAISTVTSLNTTLGALTGTSIQINGTQTINESAGTFHTVGGVTYSVFTVTSYSENDGKLFTINGDGSGDPVVLNFAGGNLNLGGDVTLTGNGLNDDKVIWNFTSTNQNIQLNNNASSYPGVAFHGIILAPHDGIHLVNANLSGRIFGGDNQDMQLVSGLTLHAPIMNTATVTAGSLTASASATITVTGPFKPPQALVSAESGLATASAGVIGNGYAVRQGTVLVYVDNSAGNITADEQAAIDDAVAVYNTELSAHGLTLVEVGPDQAANADLTITMSDTTSIGGVADGVLGVTQAGGSIILVTGWNWYTGADPSQVGASQYDFETVAMHELGHGIGLGHSPDTGSVMYPSLDTAQVRRSLASTDLTLIDSDHGAAPEPLMAAAFFRVRPALSPVAPLSEMTSPALVGEPPAAPFAAIQQSALLDQALANPVVGKMNAIDAGNSLGLATPGKESDSTVLVGGAGNDLLVVAPMIGGFGVERFSNEPTPGETKAGGSVSLAETSDASDSDAAWAAVGRCDDIGDRAAVGEAFADNFFLMEIDAVRAE